MQSAIRRIHPRMRPMLALPGIAGHQEIRPDLVGGAGQLRVMRISFRILVIRISEFV